MDSIQGSVGPFVAAQTPSPSASLPGSRAHASHASPAESWSASACAAFAIRGQLSDRSGTPSPSESLARCGHGREGPCPAPEPSVSSALSPQLLTAETRYQNNPPGEGTAPSEALVAGVSEVRHSSFHVHPAPASLWPR